MSSDSLLISRELTDRHHSICKPGKKFHHSLKRSYILPIENEGNFNRMMHIAHLIKTASELSRRLENRWKEVDAFYQKKGDTYNSPARRLRHHVFRLIRLAKQTPEELAMHQSIEDLEKLNKALHSHLEEINKFAHSAGIVPSLPKKSRRLVFWLPENNVLLGQQPLCLENKQLEVKESKTLNAQPKQRRVTPGRLILPPLMRPEPPQRLIYE